MGVGGHRAHPRAAQQDAARGRQAASRSSRATPRSTCARRTSRPRCASATTTCWRSTCPIRRPARSSPTPASRSPRRFARSSSRRASPRWTCCSRPAGRRARSSRTRWPRIRPRPRPTRCTQIYSLLRPGDAPNLETARQAIQRLFFNPKRYDLGRVGRHKINHRLKLKIDAEPHRADRRGLHRHRAIPHRPARRPRPHRRHRPSRQPPDPVGGRADRQPVLGRPLAHGAAGQGADEHQLRSGEDLARRPGERPDRVGRHPGLLRLEPAVAVHGPDQPAGRADQQAPALGARSGRPHPGARGLRSPRRALLAVRPDVPDRDAGRPEHRPDHEPRDLRAHQRPRLHRDPVPRGEGRPGHQ